jgi:Putative polyhydroxyalkanoic acid system protein (PHA_gran_rgn)
MKLTFDDAKKTGHCKSTQFSADFAIKTSTSGSSVTVALDLPFLLTPFKGKIQETLEKKLKKYLV